MKRSISIALTIMTLAMSGCMNIVGHATGDKPYTPYEATKRCANGIVEAFVKKPEWHSGSVGEASISHAYAILFLPVTVVMIPFEAVADTVTFPYDYFKMRRVNGND